jgi:hypothetical protein
VLHVILRLVSKDTHTSRLELPAPLRDVRTLRTLALLDLESHPPPAAIDRVAIVIDPTPGRVLQHTLFTRAHPTPEQLSTLVARLGALMGQDRLGAPAPVDSYRPGAFAMVPFKTEHENNRRACKERRETPRLPDTDLRRSVLDTPERSACGPSERGWGPASHGNAARASAAGVGPRGSEKSWAPREVKNIVSALRRCRQPVPARVAIADGRPIRVTTDRRGFVGGTVVQSAGPWRTSGNWWSSGSGGSGGSAHAPYPAHQPYPPHQTYWDRDEWDVALNDGAVYRIFQDRETEAWFIDAIVD